MHLFSHKNESEVKKFFNVLLYKVFLDFTADKSTYIPNLGTFKFNYKGDKIIKVNGTDKKRAVVSVDFEVDPVLAKNIGQFIDDDKSDIEKYLDNYLETCLKMRLNNG